MIDSAKLRDIAARHCLEHGPTQVQAYAAAGLAPHGTVDVQEVELEQAEDGSWLMVLRLGSEER